MGGSSMGKHGHNMVPEKTNREKRIVERWTEMERPVSDNL